MSIGLKFITALAFIVSTIAIADDSSTGMYSGTVSPKCYIDPDTRVGVLQNIDRNNDGLEDAFGITPSNSNKLPFTIRCNGSKARVTFNRPSKINGPALANGTRSDTVMTYNTNRTTSTNGSPSRTFDFNGNNDSRAIAFHITILNGGQNAAPPLRSGNYQFIFPITVSGF